MLDACFDYLNSIQNVQNYMLLYKLEEHLKKNDEEYEEFGT